MIIREDLKKKAVDKGYELDDLSEFNISAYLTEKPNFVAIQFELTYQTEGIKLPETEEVTDAVELVEGNCIYQLVDHTVSEVRFDSISLVDKAGQRIPAFGEKFLLVGEAVGRRMIPYTLRELLRE